MASLVCLPLEIFYDLLEIKNFGTNILNLRLTCRALNAKLRDLHLDSIYRSQSIFLTPIFLRNLLEISKDASAPHLRARKLNIYPEVVGIRKIQGMGIMRYNFDTPDSRLATTGRTDDGARDDQAFLDMEYLAYDHRAMLREIRDGRYKVPRALFAAVISAFPRVETIALRDRLYKILSPFEFSIFYPSLGFTPENRPSEMLRKNATYWLSSDSKYPMARWFGPHILDASDSTKAREIIMDGLARERALALSSYNAPSKKPFLPNLQQLYVYLEYMHYNDEWRESFGLWLETIGIRLTFLHVDFEDDTDFIDFMLPTSVGLPNLRTFKISSANLYIDNIMAFLYHSRAKLELLQISDCYFIDTKEDTYFRLLKYCRTTLEKLRNIVLFISSRFQNSVQRICMSADGWAPTAFCGGIAVCYNWEPVKFALRDLAGVLDANSEARGFWECLADFEKHDFSPALSLNYGGVYSSEFDDEDCESDSDYDPLDSDGDDLFDPFEYVSDGDELDDYRSDDEFEHKSSDDLEGQSDGELEDDNYL